MSKFVKLSSIAELTVGFVGTMAKHYEDEGIPFLRSLNIKPFKIISDDMKYVSAEFSNSLSKSILHKGDVVIVRTGIPGTCCVVPAEYDGCNCSDVVIVHPNTELVNPHYLAAYINFWGQRQIQNNKVGAIQQHFNVHSAEEMLIFLPDITEQEKIAKTIVALNGKIENYFSVCVELEAMAKTLYDYWFTQFDFPNENGKPYCSSGDEMVWNDQLKREIPKGWDVRPLSHVISSINTGLNPRDNFILGNGDIQYLTVKNLTTSGTIDFSGCDTVDEQTREIIHKRSDVSVGDILFASIAPLGRCYLIQNPPEKWDINESVFSIRRNASRVTSEFLYMYFMSDTFIKAATSSSTGSIFKGIRINTLLDIAAVIPPKDIVTAFTTQVKTLLALKEQKGTENRELTKLRDWLLPMLMNGQATVE